MRAFLRWCRGVLGISVLWSAAWATIFAAIVIVVGVVDPDSIDAGEGPLNVAPIGAIFGLVSGAVFAAVLSLADRRRTLGNLSLARVALWGFLGTSAFPLLTPLPNSLALVFGPVGATLAAGLVAIARRGELRAPDEQPTLTP